MKKGDKLFYAFIDVGNPIKLKNIIDLHQSNLDKKIKCPQLIVIDSTRKESASNAK